MVVSKKLFVASLLVVFVQFFGSCHGSLDAERLYTHLMRDYQKLVRPVRDNGDILDLMLSLKFTQLIGVDEVSQVISTNVVVRQTWKDYKLSWNPDDFGGITSIDIPSESIWLPDLVLYNNAEGDYQITTMTKATVNFTGDVIWEPPAIYKSFCEINVKYFPYDKQQCKMKFGCWTYDASLIDLKPARGFEADAKNITIGMDLSEYKPSIEWDILEASACRNREVFSYGTYVDVSFYLTIRRKTLFYTVNLIIPCVLISFLTVFVFYLPSDSGEKVTLCISILLSLTVFVLLLAEIIPPTSLAVPLLGRYLMFTIIMVTCSIAVTIVVINIHFRSPATHTMKPWVRTLFTVILPKILLLERPKEEHKTVDDVYSTEDDSRDSFRGAQSNSRQPAAIYSAPHQRSQKTLQTAQRSRLSEEIQDAVDGINFIVDHVRETNAIASMSHFPTIRRYDMEPGAQERQRLEVCSNGTHRVIFVVFSASFYCKRSEQESGSWIAFLHSKVLDRLFLWMFAVACLVGSGKIILDAPALYEQDIPIPRACVDPATEGYDPWICVPANEQDGTAGE